jgi:hypothetical protein
LLHSSGQACKHRFYGRSGLKFHCACASYKGMCSVAARVAAISSVVDGVYEHVADAGQRTCATPRHDEERESYLRIPDLSVSELYRPELQVRLCIRQQEHRLAWRMQHQLLNALLKPRPSLGLVQRDTIGS